MITLKTVLSWLFFLGTFQACGALSLAEQFAQVGYVEMCHEHHGTVAFDMLYIYFDELIEFLATNPVWVQKLYSAKERFIRSKDKNYYSTDFFGFYDESKRPGRNQITFYYSMHFHEFICLHYTEFNKVPEFIHFFEACREMQQPCVQVFDNAAEQLGIEHIFSTSGGHAPILFKVVKYFSGHCAKRPHYDGTAFSLFLDSTSNGSLLLAPYRSASAASEFFSPVRKFSRLSHQTSVLLIPGVFLTEFSIYPTPHIVMQSDTVRYATIAFAMRPHYIQQKNELSSLASFKY